jgi:hypothetical protein
VAARGRVDTEPILKAIDLPAAEITAHLGRRNLVVDDGRRSLLELSSAE